MSAPVYLTLAEVALVFGVSAKRAYGLIAEGAVQRHPRPGGAVYPFAELVDALGLDTPRRPLPRADGGTVTAAAPGRVRTLAHEPPMLDPERVRERWLAAQRGETR